MAIDNSDTLWQLYTSTISDQTNMKRNAIRYLLLSIPFVLLTVWLKAQDVNHDTLLTLQQVYDLAIRNNIQLKLSAKGIQLAKEVTEVNKLNNLPSISTFLNYGYLSNTDIWDPSFSNHQKSDNPGHLTQLSLSATETIYSGGKVKSILIQSDLQEKIAVLFQQKNIQDIKLIITGIYLDIYRLRTQITVYRNNEILAAERLKNINSMLAQGMVTQNDVLRTQLIISDLQLAIRNADKNIQISNIQLNQLIGFDDSRRIIPDTNLLRLPTSVKSLDNYVSAAYTGSPELEIARLERKVVKKNIDIAQSERYPTLSVFTASNLQRPFVNSIPTIDIYFNVWQAGLSLRYNISSIYQAPKKIQVQKTIYEQALTKEHLQQENLDVSVKTAFVKYSRAVDEVSTAETNIKSALENYRIVEKRYFNQLALLTDLIDATNTKIEAELKVTNARINLIYSYSYLIKTAGAL